MNRVIILSILLTLAIPVCHSATIEEAKAALDQLITTTEYHLNAASLNHTKMSNEIDSTSFWAKQHGLAEIQKKSSKFLAKLKAMKTQSHKCRGSRENTIKHFEKINSEELLSCVEVQASESVNAIFQMKTSLGDYISKAVHDEEKSLIACGQLDKDCLGRVVANIKDKINAVGAVIEDELNINRYATELQLDLIKDCAYQSISNAQLSLETVSTCLY